MNSWLKGQQIKFIGCGINFLYLNAIMDLQPEINKFSKSN